MSVIKFELTEDHLKLIKNLQWDLTEDFFVITKQPSYRNIHNFKNVSPFGGGDVFDDMFLILIGKSDREFDIMDDNFTIYSKEEKESFIKLLNELPVALEIITYCQTFELGHYKTKYKLRDWKKYEPK